MSKKLLEKVRKLNLMLSGSATGVVSFDELCESIGAMLVSDVYVMSHKGKLLAGTYVNTKGSVMSDSEEGKVLPDGMNAKLLEFTVTQDNLIDDSIKEIYGPDYANADKYHTIIPVIFGGNRVATVILCRHGEPYNDLDIAIAEYGATVVGMQVSRNIALEEEADNRERNAVNMALETLSYSELDAVVKIFSELEGDEGLLVASKVADKFNITRSVIVNALRKLESAGVIESRSLGMKGTRIKITNAFLREQVEKIDI